MQTYAIISDIHGNSLALDAVLKDIKMRGIEKIINLGDHCFGALEPEAVVDMISQNQMLCIAGNTDREILESLDGSPGKQGMDRVIAELSERSKTWLRSLPKTATCGELFFVCHGTPESDNDYLLDEVTENGVFVYDNEHLIKMTKNIKERITLCGHSHINRVVYLPNGKIILNPGSVGLPAYMGKHNFALESLSPHAKYAIVHAKGEAIAVEQVMCTYDWRAASEKARQNGNEEWTNALLWGRLPKKSE